MDYVLHILSHKKEFAITAACIGLISSVPYIWAIWNSHRPPYTTYLGWLLIGSTGFVFHYLAIPTGHSKWSALLPAVNILIPLVYVSLLICLKARWKLEKRDKWCLSAVGVSWCVWVVTDLTNITHGSSGMLVPLTALIATDVFASIPIYQNARKGLESKFWNKVSWSLGLLSTLCGLASVGDYTSLEVMYPTYLVVMLTAIALSSVTKTFPKVFVTVPAEWAPRRVSPSRSPVRGVQAGQ